MNTASTEHTVTINGTRLWLTVTGKAFRFEMVAALDAGCVRDGVAQAIARGATYFLVFLRCGEVDVAFDLAKAAEYVDSTDA